MLAEHVAMVAGLIGSGDLPSEWQPAFRQVPRHLFVPDHVWIPHEEGLLPLNRDDDQDRWIALAYSNEYIVTQADDGDTRPGQVGDYITSSASQPFVVAVMLDRLQVRPDHRVLEIGTGTGYNAALLSARLGEEQVTSIEIDAVLANNARKALTAAGCHPTVIAGDGTHGYEPNAPYDRMIATAAVRDVPYSWVAQTRPGGLIVTPWGTAYENGAIANLTVGRDRTASGRFSDDVTFMWVREQRVPVNDITQYVHDSDDAATSVSGLHPYEPVGTQAGAFSIGLQLPGVLKRTDAHGADNDVTVWLIDPESRSWARVDITPDMTDQIPVRQHGPRRLWDEVEQAHARWVDVGRPEHSDFGLTIDPRGQHVWLHEPAHRIDPRTLTAS